MDIGKIGKAIYQAREKQGMTQEQLAEKTDVSVQTVRNWENGKTPPDIENLMRIAELTNTPYAILLGTFDDQITAKDFTYRGRLFQEENMFTRMRAFALSEDLPQTCRALQYMRERHIGQFRKKAKHTTELVQYINHPLTMACQAHALGIRDDALLSAILLHDVVEDTFVNAEDLPFSEEIKELVNLVSFCVPYGESKENAKASYYADIRKNGKACVIKILDRCNNVSTMAGSFGRHKMLSYIRETEEYILPLTEVLKNQYPQYSDLSFLVKYQLVSLLETIKNLMVL